MRRLILYMLAALLVGGVLGHLMQVDAGYVLIAYDQMSLETSVWAALGALVLAYLLIRGVVYLTGRFFRSGSQLRGWNLRRRERGARRRTLRGLLLLAEGEWAGARKALLSAAPEAETPLVNYLSAARAADALGDIEGRDDHLKAALEATPGAELAVLMTRAELQLGQGQFERALATLNDLQRKTGRHPAVTRMLRDCYVGIGDWAALIELLPALKKTMDPEALATLTGRAWIGRIEATAESGDSDPVSALAAVWSTVPRPLHADVPVVTAYVDALLAADAVDPAEEAIRFLLGREWDEALAVRYGTLRSSHPKRQLSAAEGWVKSRPDDVAARLTLARVCMMNGRWEEAQANLEACLALTPDPEVYAELARVSLATGATERGVEYLARSLGQDADEKGHQQLVQTDS